VFAKGASFRPIEDLEQPGFAPDFAEGGVKETRPNGAIGFNDCGCPWRVADRRGEFGEAERGAEMSGHAAQLFGRFTDEASAVTTRDQDFDLGLKSAKVVVRQGYIVVDQTQALGRAVEGLRVRVNGEERDRIHVEQPGGAYGFDEQAAVCALDGTPG